MIKLSTPFSVGYDKISFMAYETLEKRGDGSYRTRRGFRIVPVLITIVVFVVLIYAVQLFKKPTSGETVSPVPANPVASVLSLFSPKKNPEDLKEKIVKEINGSLKNYSVYVKDLKSDFILDIGKSITYEGASINKLPIFAALYALADKGEIDLNQVVTLQADDIQNYGTGSIRYAEPGTPYSVKTLGKLMIQESDNTAAYILGRQIIGMDKIQALLPAWGMTQTNMEENSTSNSDVAILMERIYKGQVANQSSTKEMLSILKEGEINDRIPAKLPKDVTIYHKTGNAVGFLHDVGIVDTPKAVYYIGIMTSDVTDEAATTNTIANVSKIVYDFMNK